MLRRVHVAAVGRLTTRASVRHGTTGFSLFTTEVQRASRVLSASSLKLGQRNMVIMSFLWRKMPRSQRVVYNLRARNMHLLRMRNAHKRHNLFNLIMRLFARNPPLLRAGNEGFVTRIATNTMRVLRKRDVRRLCDTFHVDANTVLNAVHRSTIRTIDAAATAAAAAAAVAAAEQFDKHAAGERVGGGAKDDKDAAAHEAASTAKSEVMDVYRPHMKYFDSFTQMQRAVAPTRRDVFMGMSAVIAAHVERQPSVADMHARFAALPPARQAAFYPVSDAEAAVFETFCARHAAHMHPRHFDILLMLAYFRGVVRIPERLKVLQLTASSLPSSSSSSTARATTTTTTPTTTAKGERQATSDGVVAAATTQQTVRRERVRLYRALLSNDRSHDTLYHKVQRALERLRSARSSECGFYFVERQRRPTHVPPSTYNLLKGIDDVAVSAMLAETRHNVSVYDDVLQRAAVLRPQAAAAKLQSLYMVPEDEYKDMTRQTMRHLQLRAPMHLQLDATVLQQASQQQTTMKAQQQRQRQKRRQKTTTSSTPRSVTATTPTLRARGTSARPTVAATRTATEATATTATTTTTTRTSTSRAHSRQHHRERDTAATSQHAQQQRTLPRQQRVAKMTTAPAAADKVTAADGVAAVRHAEKQHRSSSSSSGSNSKKKEKHVTLTPAAATTMRHAAAPPAMTAVEAAAAAAAPVAAVRTAAPQSTRRRVHVAKRPRRQLRLARVLRRQTIADVRQALLRDKAVTSHKLVRAPSGTDVDTAPTAYTAHRSNNDNDDVDDYAGYDMRSVLDADVAADTPLTLLGSRGGSGSYGGGGDDDGANEHNYTHEAAHAAPTRRGRSGSRVAAAAPLSHFVTTADMDEDMYTPPMHTASPHDDFAAQLRQQLASVL